MEPGQKERRQPVARVNDLNDAERKVRMKHDEPKTPEILAHLLRFPLRELGATWARTKHKRDLFALVDAAVHWPVVTPLYSGLEQALKVLLADEMERTIEEVGGPKGELARTCQHHLGKCWDRLKPESRAVIEEHWSQFISLHRYMAEGEEARPETATAGAFLWHLSGGEKGGGYERWRYSLIEMHELPKVSVEGMMQIWDSVLQIYEKRIRPGSRQTMRGPLERIVRRINTLWEQASWKAEMEIQQGPEREQYDCAAVRREHARWLANHGWYANSAADILWRGERALPAADPDGPERVEVRRTLELLGPILRKELAETEDPSLAEWGRRARTDGIRLQPDSKGRAAECKMGIHEHEGRWQEESPEGSIVAYMDDEPFRQGRDTLLMAYSAGYEVREHAAGRETEEGFGLWFEATKGEGADKTQIRVWRCGTPPPGLMALEVEGDRGEPVAEMALLQMRFADQHIKGERVRREVVVGHWGGGEEDEGEVFGGTASTPT